MQQHTPLATRTKTTEKPHKQIKKLNKILDFDQKIYTKSIQTIDNGQSRA